MPGRNLSTVAKLLVASSVLLLQADRAMAYGGPGVDVTFVSYAMMLLVWVLTAFSAVLLWPVYAFLRGIRRRKHESTTAPSLEAAPEQAQGAATPTGNGDPHARRDR
jgi:hypothetical protein